MGAISFFNFHLLKLKIIAENQCEKHKKKSSLIVYNASKESVISILGNTLIQICVFDRKKTPAVSIASNSVFDRKDVQIYLWDRTLHLW